METFKTINNGWVHVAISIREYTHWENSYPLKSTQIEGTFDYEMIWTAKPTGNYFISTRVFTIKSSYSGNEIRFSIKTDRDKSETIFKLSEMDKLKSHIANHFQLRGNLFSTKYTQLKRIEAVLDNIPMTNGHASFKEKTTGM